MTPVYKRGYREAGKERRGQLDRSLAIFFTEFKGRIRSGWVIFLLVVCLLSLTVQILNIAFGAMFIVDQSGIAPEGDTNLMFGTDSDTMLIISPGGNGNVTIVVTNQGETASTPEFDIRFESMDPIWKYYVSNQQTSIGPGETVEITIPVEHDHYVSSTTQMFITMFNKETFSNQQTIRSRTPM